MEQAPAETARRIAQYRALGGRDLDPEDHDLLAEVRSGIAAHAREIFWFQCMVCGRREGNNQDMEPMCTGPSWTDDHAPEIMQRITPR